MGRHSRLQKQVLGLYRSFLRAGKDKPGFVPRIRAEFRKNAEIPRSDVMLIEYLVRRGQRQLEQLRNAQTKQMGIFGGLGGALKLPPDGSGERVPPFRKVPERACLSDPFQMT
uniref:Complex 1 LYR protein domain-containing protein n=1 Tax=Salvator merianae TaxID=96440 RepID=A0A8D0DPQ2_SALMN